MEVLLEKEREPELRSAVASALATIEGDARAILLAALIAETALSADVREKICKRIAGVHEGTAE